MAQVDFVNYFSILFWFFLLFITFYLVNYTLLLPNIFSIITIRKHIYIKNVNFLKFKIICFIKNIKIFIVLKNSFIFLLYCLQKCIYI